MLVSSTHNSAPAAGKGMMAIRLLLSLLLLGMCAIGLFVSFKGLSHASVMDQAQIARNVACNQGLTTNFITPLDLNKVEAAAQAQKKENAEPMDVGAFPNIHQAPLNIYAMAAALRITGYHDYAATRAELEADGKLSHRIYPGDRVIAAVSTVFFILAMVLGYTLITRLFDEIVAASVAALIMFNSTMMAYATSGLPQPLMMCCLLGAGHFILSAVGSRESTQIVAESIHLALAFFCLGLMALTGWGALWCTIGLGIFCAVYFKRNGFAYMVGGFILVFLMTYFVASTLVAPYGDTLNYYFFCVADSFGLQGTATALRSGIPSAAGANGASFILYMFGHALANFGHSVQLMGGLFVTGIFFLSMLFLYRKSRVEGFKWAFFLMWLFAGVGMSLTGGPSEISATQLNILFLPIFAAFGMALIYNFTAKLNISPQLSVARGFVFVVIFIISAAPLLSTLPGEIRSGIMLRGLGQANFPPYYPPALYGRLEPTQPGFVDLTNPQDIIITDQPWAVAWYGNRKAVWLPESVEAFNNIRETLSTVGRDIQGILITPTSTSDVDKGLIDITARNGEFTPLAMEAMVLVIDPKHRMRLTDLFTDTPSRSSTAAPLGSIVSSKGTYARPHFLLGAHYVLYTRP